MNYIKQEDVRGCWERLQGRLSGKTLEIETWSIPSRSGSFYARAVSDRVFIEGKNIKGIRTVSYPEFEKLARYYNDYLDGVAEVKQRMRGDVGYNTPYVLSLLHYVLETPEEEAPPEPEKRPEPVRKRFYRARTRRY